jgi:hypothetical protein
MVGRSSGRQRGVAWRVARTPTQTKVQNPHALSGRVGSGARDRLTHPSAICGTPGCVLRPIPGFEAPEPEQGAGSQYSLWLG